MVLHWSRSGQKYGEYFFSLNLIIQQKTEITLFWKKLHKFSIFLFSNESSLWENYSRRTGTFFLLTTKFKAFSRRRYFANLGLKFSLSPPRNFFKALWNFCEKRLDFLQWFLMRMLWHTLCMKYFFWDRSRVPLPESVAATLKARFARGLGCSPHWAKPSLDTYFLINKL